MTTTEKGYSHRLYIDNTLNGASSLIYGDMSETGRTITINGSLTVTDDVDFSSASISANNIIGGVSIPSNKNIGLYTFNNITVGGSTTNTYLGYNTAASGRTNSGASRNTYLGYQAGRYQTSGNHNTFIGSEAGYYTTIGSVNTFIGNRAGYQNRDGRRNCALGHYSGYYVKGNNNIIIGYNAGPTGTSYGAHCIYLDPVTRRGSDSLIFGYAYGTSTRYARINGKLYIKYGYAAYSSYWYTYSDISLKKNISKIDGNINDKIDMLEPVNYTLKSNDKKEVGFIAQEVKKVFPLLVNEGKSGILTVDYSKLTSYLVKGMQESNQKIKDLEGKLEAEKNAREQMEKIFREEIEKLRKEIIQK